MKRRPWDANANVRIGRAGLQGKPGAAIGSEQHMSQAQDDQWRDQFLTHATNAFEDPQRLRKEARLRQEHARLKPLVGALTCE